MMMSQSMGFLGALAKHDRTGQDQIERRDE